MRKQLWQVTWDHHARNLLRSFEFMRGTPENANDTFLPGVSLLIWCVVFLICVCVSPLVHPLQPLLAFYPLLADPLLHILHFPNCFTYLTSRPASHSPARYLPHFPFLITMTSLMFTRRLIDSRAWNDTCMPPQAVKLTLCITFQNPWDEWRWSELSKKIVQTVDRFLRGDFYGLGNVWGQWENDTTWVSLVLVCMYSFRMFYLLEFDIVPMSTITLLVFQGLDFFIYFDMLIRVKPRQ